MSPSQSTIRKATPKQLRYLRVLAEQTGTSFTSPESSSQASREIQRLTQLKKTRGRHTEPPENGNSHQHLVYGTAPHADEISGWGSQASWKTTSAPRQGPAAKPSTVGERTELARYTARGEERVIYGQRINGSVRITDRPAAGPGRSYLIERGLEQDGYVALQALVVDYVAQSRELDQVPMAASLTRAR
jgi:hypothetical protein